MSGRVIIYIIVWLVLASIGYSCKSTQNVYSEKLIQKRKYRSGFYVNNHKKVKGTKDDLHILSQEISSVEELVTEENSSLEPIAENQNSETNETNKPEKVNYKKVGSSPVISLEKGSVKSVNLNKRLIPIKNKKELVLSIDDTPKQKLDPVGLIGLIVMILGIILFTTVSLLWIGGMLIFLAIILSLLSLSRITKSNGTLKGKWFALSSLILVGISLLAFILAVIIIINF